MTKTEDLIEIAEKWLNDEKNLYHSKFDEALRRYVSLLADRAKEVEEENKPVQDKLF